ncbi:hypothetical protein CLLI_16300 [Clostridium liquoris]|jgi:hypothetical protein|uniref:Uncharacterized protein n=1 Tax=Clostridium liquoris TaxID=1289519 RepID=A0A2T0B3U2_9CLOT|nr:hypothetical protein [Clostridium liquoris]PRR78546.1 hypothetical protein CLLI_16300 [Clostridium liquoris]
MSVKKTMKTINQSAETSTNNSRNAKNGYMNRGNSSKQYAENGTRNKN